MKSTHKTASRGLVVQPDDLEIGRHYAVYGLKRNPTAPVPISGMAFKLLAMNLPFVVGKLASEPAQGPVTFDARFLSFMKVTEDFVNAQRPDPSAPSIDND